MNKAFELFGKHVSKFVLATVIFQTIVLVGNPGTLNVVLLLINIFAYGLCKELDGNMKGYTEGLNDSLEIFKNQIEENSKKV